MRKDFAEVFRLTLAAMKSEVKVKLEVDSKKIWWQVIIYLIVCSAVFFALYKALNPPSFDLLLATSFTFSTFKFFLYLTIGSWALFFAYTFIVILIDNTFLYSIRRKVSLAMTGILVFSLILVFQVNFVRDDVEARSVKVIEEKFGNITSLTFKQMENGTFVGTARVEKSDEGKLMEYTVKTKTYERGSSYMDYAVEVEYRFIDEK